MAKTRRIRDPRKLIDLTSIGPAAVADFDRLGIREVRQLRGKSARGLYERLCRLTGERHDPCCEDVFAAAIAQAEDPGLPAMKRRWWYWSRVRKSRRAP